MKTTILVSLAAVALLGACTESNRGHRESAVRHHNAYVQDSKAHSYKRQNIDSPAPWANKRNHVPGYTDRAVVYPRKVR